MAHISMFSQVAQRSSVVQVPLHEAAPPAPPVAPPLEPVLPPWPQALAKAKAKTKTKGRGNRMRMGWPRLGHSS
jgi:hypothetical protein